METYRHQSSTTIVRRCISGLFALVFIAGLMLSFVVPARADATPPGTILPPADSIYKIASQPIAKQGDTFTYTIHLGGKWAVAVILLADVKDPIPEGLEYVPGSDQPAGAYDPASHTISWSKVQVSAGAPVDLKFDVKVTAAVNLPTPVVNTAFISLMDLTMQRQAWVTLLPPGPSTSPLAPSFKSASPFMLGPGDVVTYAIHLVNSSTIPQQATVTDPVPAPLVYVPGSASDGGVYDGTTKTITWTDINVPSAISMTAVAAPVLTFKASAPDTLATNARSLLVTNTATITSGNASFLRKADVLLVYMPQSPLDGSFKAASQKAVAPGQKLTYSIYLHNSSASDLTATVTDPLPVEVNYVDGSANAGGIYDPDTRTITWTDISVLDDTPVTLTFDVTANALPANSIIHPFVNTAAITTGDITIRRSVQVILLPAPGGDLIPPVVTSFVIGDQDVLTGPDVTLHIQAVDNVKVAWMDIKEWQLTPLPFPHWQEVKSSGWVPYQEDYAWTLTNQSGTHYMGVWVADAAKNRSRLTGAAVDFASLLLPATHLDAGDKLPYLVYYPAGVEVTASLDVTSGAARLFVWMPGNMFAPDLSSATPATNPQKITFTTKRAGVYMFLVAASQASIFDLSITPGGGPRLPLPTAASPGAATAGVTTGPASPAQADDFTYNPILTESGLDPLSTAEEPAGPYYVYLPVVQH